MAARFRRRSSWKSAAASTRAVASTTRSIGNHAEQAALDYLKRRGLKLVTRNYACRSGEIDLIMRDAGTLVFVEVRFRRSRDHASGAESVTRSKIRKLLRTAEVYLHTHQPSPDQSCRFDVVSVSMDPENYSIDWITEAFTTEDY